MLLLKARFCALAAATTVMVAVRGFGSSAPSTEVICYTAADCANLAAPPLTVVSDVESQILGICPGYNEV